MKFNKFFQLAICSITAASIFVFLAMDKTHVARAVGGPTVSGVGSWGLGITMTGSSFNSISGMANWNSGGGSQDYISIVDAATAVFGAHLNIKANSQVFIYSGNGVGNTGLLQGTNVYIMAKTNNTPTKGKDDTSKTANLITSESCGSAQTTDIAFNSLFSSGSRSNSVRIGTSYKTVFQISTTCTTSTRLNFEKVRIFYPALTTTGTYTNSFTLSAVDGLP